MLEYLEVEIYFLYRSFWHFILKKRPLELHFPHKKKTWAKVIE